MVTISGAKIIDMNYCLLFCCIDVVDGSVFLIGIAGNFLTRSSRNQGVHQLPSGLTLCAHPLLAVALHCTRSVF